MDRVHRRSVADHADQRGDDDGAGISAALALRTRYRGQALVAAGGAAGAAALLVIWAIQSGIGG